MSVWEQDQDAVKPFVKEMGDKMDYRVAMDDVPREADGNDGAMAKTWMKAAGQNGIPTAFIVDKDGKIAWIGHPMEMDEPLEKIVNGSWDLTAASARSRKESENRAAIGLEAAVAGLRNQIQLRPDDGGLYSNYGRLLGNLGRHDEAIEACRKAIQLNPNDGGAHYNLGQLPGRPGPSPRGTRRVRRSPACRAVAEPVSTMAAPLPRRLRRGPGRRREGQG